MVLEWCLFIPSSHVAAHPSVSCLTNMISSLFPFLTWLSCWSKASQYSQLLPPCRKAPTWPGTPINLAWLNPAGRYHTGSHFLDSGDACNCMTQTDCSWKGGVSFGHILRWIWVVYFLSRSFLGCFWLKIHFEVDGSRFCLLHKLWASHILTGWHWKLWAMENKSELDVLHDPK